MQDGLMDVPIIVFIILFLSINFIIIDFDIQKKTHTNQNIFETLRAANQNALIEVRDKLNNNEEVYVGDLLERWLINFCDNNSLDIKDINVTIYSISLEPVPMIVVGIDGYNDKYLILDGDIVSKYTNGSILLEEK